MRKIVSFILTAILLIGLFASYGCGNIKPTNVNTIGSSVKTNKGVDNTVKKAKELRLSKDYNNALKTLDEIDVKKQNDEILKLRNDIIAEYKGVILPKVNALIMKYDYAGAKSLLEEIYPFTSEDTEIKKLYTTCTSYKDLVPYKGTIEHIFFHPLIVYPELTFDGDASSVGFDNYFVTVPEFKKIIAQLYERNYILIDIRLIYEVNKDGSVKTKQLMLPKDKKPLIISLDDYNFLRYMRKDGCVHGLALDKDENVVTYTDSKDGKRTFSNDNESVPILDSFVKEHPDFSFGGAKGTIALNGYEGALGFPTDELNSPDYSKNLEAARAVANRLKETGWTFACHSYCHYSPKKRTLSQFKNDVDKWIKEVGAVVGKTDIYIYPFGELIKDDDPKFKYMLDNGYKIFCGVGSRPYLKFHDKYVLQARRNIDGIAFRKNRLSDMLDVSKIIDPVRPSFKNQNKN